MNFSAIKKLDLLKKLYKEILIPYAVWDEVVEKGKGQPGVEEVEKASWIKKEMVSNISLVETLTLTLDRGEAEAIALAKEKNAELLLIDERLARNVAKHLGLNYIGLLGVLREAKSNGLIRNVKKYMDLLRTVAGFWISEEVYKDILKREGEL
jgi:predicted nucleic acid-binding protein